MVDAASAGEATSSSLSELKRIIEARSSLERVINVRMGIVVCCIVIGILREASAQGNVVLGVLVEALLVKGGRLQTIRADRIHFLVIRGL